MYASASGPPSRAELRLKLVEEAEVDVDVAVVRTVERPDRGRRPAASGLDRAVEEARRRRLVAAERLVPVRLDAVDARQDPAVLALVRVRSGLALLREVARGLRRARRSDRRASRGRRGHRRRPRNMKASDDEQHDDPAAAAELERNSAGQTASATAVVLDLRGIELRVLAKPHGANLPRCDATGTCARAGSGRAREAISRPARAPARRPRDFLLLQVAPANHEDRDQHAGEHDRRGRPERGPEAVGQRRRARPCRSRGRRPSSRPRSSRGSRCRPRRRSAATC